MTSVGLTGASLHPVGIDLHTGSSCAEQLTKTWAAKRL